MDKEGIISIFFGVIIVSDELGFATLSKEEVALQLKEITGESNNDILFGNTSAKTAMKLPLRKERHDIYLN